VDVLDRYREQLSRSFSDADVEWLLETPEGRRMLSASSVAFFDSYYCGMNYAPFRERWLEDYEKTYQRAQTRRSKEKFLRLAPRDHGKTESLITYVAWKICHERDLRVLWICATQTVSTKRVARILGLLGSKRIQEDFCGAPEDGFGPFKDTTKPNTSTMLYVVRDKQSIDPTLEGVGSGGDITGGHFDLIIGDDLENDKTTYTARVRQKTRNWFFGTVGPILTRGGAELLVGTRKHHDDLYAHLIKKKGLWRSKNDPAVTKWPSGSAEGVRFIFGEDEDGEEFIERVEYEGEAEVLWPDGRPFDYLMQQKYEMGTLLFYREMQNQVQDDGSGSAPFKSKWLEFAKERGAGLRLGSLPAGVTFNAAVWAWDVTVVDDEERARENDNDYTVGTLLARATNGDRYILDTERFRGLSQQEKLNTFEAAWRRWEVLAPGLVTEVIIEKNSFGHLYVSGLKRETDVPVRGHHTSSKKSDPYDGVPSLSKHFENGKFVFPYGDERSREMMDILATELWGLGKEPHDDCVMSLWIAETGVRSSFRHRVAMGLDERDDITPESARATLARVAVKKAVTQVQLEDAQTKSAWAGLDAFLGGDSIFDL